VANPGGKQVATAKNTKMLAQMEPAGIASGNFLKKHYRAFFIVPLETR
jgi:hypothetical protein